MVVPSLWVKIDLVFTLNVIADTKGQCPFDVVWWLAKLCSIRQILVVYTI